MARKRGEELLREQAVGLVDAVYSDLGHETYDIGASPIERLFFRAVMLCGWLGREDHGISLINEHVVLGDDPPDWEKRLLWVEPQVQLPGWRVDFMFYAWSFGSVWNRGKGRQYGKEGWRRLIVECDGHDYHEKTKEQAKRDRGRDRWAADNGYDLYRFTGSEIHNDPLGCARKAFSWAGASL